MFWKGKRWPIYELHIGAVVRDQLEDRFGHVEGFVRNSCTLDTLVQVRLETGETVIRTVRQLATRG